MCVSFFLRVIESYCTYYSTTCFFPNKIASDSFHMGTLKKKLIFPGYVMIDPKQKSSNKKSQIETMHQA